MHNLSIFLRDGWLNLKRPFLAQFITTRDIRELKDKKDTLEISFDRLSRTKPPPPHLFRDETIEQFQEIVNTAFRNGSNRRTIKHYLRLFIDRITIQLPMVEIEANTKGILTTIQNKNAVRAGVLTASVSWLLG